MVIHEFRHDSQILGREKFALAIVPNGATVSGVCYLLHGYAGNRFSWLRNTDLNRPFAAEGIVAVVPESGRRWFINDHEGRRYESYLVHELVPWAEQMLRVSVTRERRFIGGFSMGGAAAVMQALRHRWLFGAAFASAGAFEACHRIGDPYAALRRRRRILMPSESEHNQVWGPPGSYTRAEYDPAAIVERRVALGGDLPRLRLDVGRGDFPRMVGMVRRFRDVLVRLRVAHEYDEIEGGHEWDYVTRALDGTREFLRRGLVDKRPPLQSERR